jgi:hypothetical protein
LPKLTSSKARAKSGAAGGNRTLETTLEEWSFTTKLRPRSVLTLMKATDTVKPSPHIRPANLTLKLRLVIKTGCRRTTDAPIMGYGFHIDA